MTTQDDAPTLETVELKLEELTTDQLNEATGGGKVQMQDFHFVMRHSG